MNQVPQFHTTRLGVRRQLLQARENVREMQRRLHYTAPLNDSLPSSSPRSAMEAAILQTKTTLRRIDAELTLLESMSRYYPGAGFTTISLMASTIYVTLVVGTAFSADYLLRFNQPITGAVMGGFVASATATISGSKHLSASAIVGFAAGAALGGISLGLGLVPAIVAGVVAITGVALAVVALNTESRTETTITTSPSFRRHIPSIDKSVRGWAFVSATITQMTRSSEADVQSVNVGLASLTRLQREPTGIVYH